MRLNTLAFTVGLAVMSASAYSAVTLDGRSLTQEQAWAAANGEEVVIAPEAMKHLTDSYNLVMTAARQGVDVQRCRLLTKTASSRVIWRKASAF